MLNSRLSRLFLSYLFFLQWVFFVHTVTTHYVEKGLATEDSDLEAPGPTYWVMVTHFEAAYIVMLESQEAYSHHPSF